MMGVVVVVVVAVVPSVFSAPCCGPKQWAAEVRRVTMDTTSSHTHGIQEWHWVSYDLDMQKVVIITFDPRPGKSDLYRRELLDFHKGMHYVTPDEFKCSSSPLSGKMPRLCVPPTGGNITLDVRMFFGVYPDPDDPLPQRPLTTASHSHRRLLKSHDHYSRSNPTLRDGSFGMYAETIYYETDDVTGYVTVTSLTCAFVNEMTYATGADGHLEWQHTQWNNITLTVNPESFDMPQACFNHTHTAQFPTVAQRNPAYGQMDKILGLF